MNKEEAKLNLFLQGAYRRMERDAYEAASMHLSDLRRAGGCDGPLRTLRGHPDQPEVYGYQMMWGYAGEHGGPIPEPMGFRLGCHHAIDIAFFFDVWDSIGVNRLTFTDENRRGREELAHAMMDYAAAFAHHGTPNAPGSSLPVWQPWSNDPGGPKLLRLDGDRERAHLEMGTDELTLADVRAALEKLPDPIREQVSELARSDRGRRRI